MYGFLLRPRWIAFHLLVAGAVVLMLNLGFWQLRRLDERRDFNATVEERIEADTVPLAALLAEPGFDPDGAEWRSVSAAGTYLPGQILVFNRSQDGRAGDNVLTALQVDDGPIVLVNRGFVPLGADVPEAPATAVEVLGRARPSQERGRGGLTDSTEGPVTEVRRIEIERIAPQFDGEVAPVYLDLVASVPEVGPGDPAPVPAPETNSGPHLSYAIQWFVFSLCVLIGWVLAVRRSIGKRRQEEARLTSGADEPAEAGSPPPDDAVSTTVPNGTATPSER